MSVMRYLKMVYVTQGVDIFGFKVKNGNSTYHHIIKAEDLKLLGFSTSKTFENGIILSERGHSYLHKIEELAPDIFGSINKIILLITKERRLPTLEERQLLQYYLEAFEYRMKDYLNIDKSYLIRVRDISKEKEQF